MYSYGSDCSKCGRSPINCECSKKKNKMNLTKESEEGKDTKQTTIKKPDQRDSTKIVKYLKDNFGELCNYDYASKTVYLCDNNVLGTPAFTEFLKKWRVFVQPSLF